MERECQEECVLIHFDLLRETIDRYLKKHSFCDECTKMVSSRKKILFFLGKNNKANWLFLFQVNKAYNMLVVEDDCSSGESSDHEHNQANNCKAPIPVDTDHKKISKIYNGLTSCVSDQHVHVECKEEVVGHLIGILCIYS